MIQSCYMTTEELEQIRKIIREETINKEEFKAEREYTRKLVKEEVQDAKKALIQKIDNSQEDR